MKKTHRLLFCAIAIWLLCFQVAAAQDMPIPANLSKCNAQQTCTWHFGDGKTATGCEPMTHKYNVPDTYEVIVEIDCGEMSQTTSRRVEVETRYDWNTGNWKPQKGCGEVNQTRNVKCINVYSKKSVAKSKCEDEMPEKERTVTLNNDSCPTCRYDWPEFYVDEHDWGEWNVFFWDGERVCDTKYDDCSVYHQYPDVVFRYTSGHRKYPDEPAYSERHVICRERLR